MPAKRVPVIQQLNAVECGAACLAMILSYYGRRTSVSECRDKCSPGRDGLTARTIVKAGREYGLRVKAYSLEPEHLKHIPLPAIAHWNFNHFIVIERLSAKGVEVVDPGSGRRQMSHAEFSEAFTGVILAFEPGAHFEKRERRGGRVAWSSYLRTMLSVPGARGALATVLAGSLLVQVLGLVPPLLTKFLVDTVLPFRITGLMNVLGIGLLLVVAGQSVLSYVRNSVLIRLRGRLDSQLMFNFFEHLLTLPFSFFQRRTSGDLLMRLSSNSFIREVLTSNTLSVFLDGSFVVIYLAILLYVSPTFGLLVAGLGTLQILIIFSTRQRVRALMQRELAAKASEQGYLVEAVSGISMLKASGAEDRAFERWSDLFNEQLNVSLERSRVSMLIENALSTLRMISPLLLLWFGALQILDGRLSLGEMLALTALAASFLAPITTLVMNAQQILLIGAHLERIADVLDAEPEQAPNGDCIALKPSGRIEVRDLSFSYDSNSPPVLSCVSFSVEPGQKVALVGETGSGKSTLAMLMLGLYRPTSGDVLYDGVPLTKLNFRALRAQVGVVLQEPVLFSGSVMQNLTLNNPAAAVEKVMKAAEIAGLHDDIMKMPMGYETFVSEGATTLSGGQRQRLAIARALAHEPSILLLDEATSHLDAVTEARVDGNLSGLSCTRVVIAHRLSTVSNADQILVLHEGAIVERGTHDELMAAGGHYATLVRTGDEESTCADPVAAGTKGVAVLNDGALIN
jgi:ATP-binding cassette, subfamily B, bacterial